MRREDFDACDRVVRRGHIKRVWIGSGVGVDVLSD